MYSCRRLCTVSHLAKDYFVTECGSWLLVAQKPVLKRQGWWKGKSALFRRLAAGGWVDSCSKANSRLTVGRALKGDFRGVQAKGGPHAEQHTRLWRSSCGWSSDGGLISTILVVLHTVSLQFQVHLFFISLNPVFGIVAAYVVAAVGSSCS